MTCAYCNQPLPAQHLAVAGQRYHSACYYDRVQPKCIVCRQGINGSYRQDIWGNSACASHTLEGCDSCGRLMPSAGPREQGRSYCATCAGTAVMPSAIASGTYQRILKTYKRYGIRNVPEDVPIHIVSAAAMAAKCNATPGGMVLGLAVTRYKAALFSTTKAFSHDIYILAGLPRLEFESVLAHELLHTWLNQYEVKMSEAEVEGFCNLGSYLVLSIDDSKHAHVLMKQIKDDRSQTYGAGFRRMLAEVKQKGWQTFLDGVRAKKYG